jgi:glutamate synthase (NADPH/NADH) small chain
MAGTSYAALNSRQFCRPYHGCGSSSTFTSISTPDSDREIPCQRVLLALGFTGPRVEGLLNELEIDLDPRGNMLADDKAFVTNQLNVFVAGYMRRGQSLVVWAISEGREAARQVDLLLTGKTALPSKNTVGMFA